MKRSTPAVYFFSLLVLLSLFQSFRSSQIPGESGSELLNRANISNLKFPQEKVYLHFDRNSYLSNDDIWFKAYLLNSPIPDCNLYVELVNSSGTVILKNTQWVQNGLAYGDFHIADTISSGIYQVRAYTSWMRNFDEWWFFRKDIIIWNLGDREFIARPEKIQPRDIEMNFFPEGGTFIAGLENRVAFKAADENGKGLNVEGEVFDRQGRQVATFKSLHKGMGTFQIVPEADNKYWAKVRLNGITEKNTDLPEVRPGGVLLKIETIGDIINIDIKEKWNSGESPDTSGYLLTGRTGGNVIFQQEVMLSGGIAGFNLDKTKLPSGIIQFTLFGAGMIPICERLVYVENNDLISLEINTGKKEYKPREKVLLDIKALTSEGVPCLANLSLSVVNTGAQLKSEDFPNNIQTQFLLGSELRGLIEEPAYYFKDDSLSTRQALDNLMLTHGYRYFDWEEIREDRMPEIDFPPEECIQVRGTVRSILLDKPLQDCDVTMMTVKGQLIVKETKSDSAGKFLFSDLYFMDTLYIAMQTTNSKGKRTSYIQVDKRTSVSPLNTFLPFYYHYDYEKPVLSPGDFMDIRSDLIKKKWRLSDTIMLGDVTVVAPKKKQDDGNWRMYNEADFVYDMDRSDDPWANVFQAIEGKLPGVRWEEENQSFIFRNRPVLLYLDGLPSDYQLLSTFPSQSIDKVELLKMAIFAGINYDGAALFIYTKRGEMFHNNGKPAVGMKSLTITGYSLIRRFYAPSYDNPKKPVEKRDYRITLYWNPVIRTGSDGTARESFYGSDDSGQMEIIAEGITSEGKLCRGTASYTVVY